MSSKKTNQDLQTIRVILTILARKGFLEVLWHLAGLGKASYYNDIRRYALENKIVESRASVTVILNNLTKAGLLERRVITESAPLRTTYSVSNSGKAVVDLLKQLGHEVK